MAPNVLPAKASASSVRAPVISPLSSETAGTVAATLPSLRRMANEALWKPPAAFAVSVMGASTRSIAFGAVR